VNIFVQGQKRVTLGGTTYLCDESTFLLSSLDLPVVSQIVVASEEVPLLSLLFKLDMVLVREILNDAEFKHGMVYPKLGVSPLERRRRIC
jgi:hypothetical protein